MLLTDLADACRKSGLRVVEVPGWRTLGRPASTGGFAPRGTLCHHTGAKDTNPLSIVDDLEYAKWLAKIGRSDLPAPLCQVSLGRDSTVYVCAAGRGNHAGKAKAQGGIPAGDGNLTRLGIEAQNNGTEGWSHKGTDAAGNTITQGEGYVRLVAALHGHYEWPARACGGHKETSLTGKWDPGALDMDEFRADVQARMHHPNQQEEDDMTPEDRKLLVEARDFARRALLRGQVNSRALVENRNVSQQVLDELAELDKGDAKAGA